MYLHIEESIKRKVVAISPFEEYILTYLNLTELILINYKTYLRLKFLSNLFNYWEAYVLYKNYRHILNFFSLKKKKDSNWNDEDHNLDQISESRSSTKHSFYS